MDLHHGNTLVGIDEAGRGPLAGPVAVGACAVRSQSVLQKFEGVRDSKQLSPLQRETWFAEIVRWSTDGTLAYAVCFCGPEVIDKRGISWAIYSSVNRCLQRLEQQLFIDPTSRILLDGSLYASARYRNQTIIINGDAHERIIALASICAKVLRDRKMAHIAQKYPSYNFEIHKGYGTRAHYHALEKYGISPIHRRSFLRNFEK